MGLNVSMNYDNLLHHVGVVAKIRVRAAAAAAAGPKGRGVIKPHI